MFERDLRNMALVKRWGIVATHADQNLAEHSYFVAVYANDLCLVLGVTDDVRLDVLKVALGHDLDEILTCDIPGPHKRFVMINNSHWLYKSMEKIFPRRGDRWGVGIDKAILVKAIVKVADILESVLFLAEEQRMGNCNVQEHRRVLYDKLMESTRCLVDVGASVEGGAAAVRAIEHAVSDGGLAPMQNSRITYDGDD